MEAILTVFGSVSEVKSAAVSPVAVGDLVAVHVTATYVIGARVKAIDAERGILIRETLPLTKIPAGWEAAQFYARPDSVFPAY